MVHSAWFPNWVDKKPLSLPSWTERSLQWRDRLFWLRRKT